jgi:hypothetical protein
MVKMELMEGVMREYNSVGNISGSETEKNISEEKYLESKTWRLRRKDRIDKHSEHKGRKADQ